MALDIREMTFQNVIDRILKPNGVKVGGYPEEIFLELTDEEREKWACNICFLILNEGRECTNKHMFCNTCIFAWTLTYGENSQKCPVCRTPQQTYKESKDVNKMIADKRVRCSEENCTYKSPLRFYLYHSHGKQRYSNAHVDLESLRPARTSATQIFVLPPLGGASGGGPERVLTIRQQLEQGRLMIHQMVLLLHLEMQLRQRALVSYSRAENTVDRLSRLDEVLALNEQLNEVGTILSTMLSDPMGRSGAQRASNARMPGRTPGVSGSQSGPGTTGSSTGTGLFSSTQYGSNQDESDSSSDTDSSESSGVVSRMRLSMTSNRRQTDGVTASSVGAAARRDVPTAISTNTNMSTRSSAIQESASSTSSVRPIDLARASANTRDTASTVTGRQLSSDATAGESSTRQRSAVGGQRRTIQPTTPTPRLPAIATQNVEESNATQSTMPLGSSSLRQVMGTMDRSPASVTQSSSDEVPVSSLRSTREPSDSNNASSSSTEAVSNANASRSNQARRSINTRNQTSSSNANSSTGPTSQLTPTPQPRRIGSASVPNSVYRRASQNDSTSTQSSSNVSAQNNHTETSQQRLSFAPQQRFRRPNANTQSVSSQPVASSPQRGNRVPVANRDSTRRESSLRNANMTGRSLNGQSNTPQPISSSQLPTQSRSRARSDSLNQQASAVPSDTSASRPDGDMRRQQSQRRAPGTISGINRRGPTTPGQLLRARRRSEIMEELLGSRREDDS